MRQRTRHHGYVACLWLLPQHADGRYSLLRLEKDEATIRRYVDSRTRAECVIVPVAELLREAGV